jgi:valyl-tRNA synthetase
LVLAQWPIAGPTDESAESLFAKLQEIIVAIRNVRNEYKVDQKKQVIVSIATPGDFASQIESNRELIDLLATCTLQQVQPALPMPANAARSMAADCEVFVHDMVNADAEKQRTAKACESLKQKASALRGRLSNASYAEKAPAHLVQQTRDELAKVEEEMSKLGCN